jgi:DNA polymerase-3 subunit alpha
LRTGAEHDPLVRLGGNFELDGELAERIQDIPGIMHVSLRAKPSGAHLRLVA